MPSPPSPSPPPAAAFAPGEALPLAGRRALVTGASSGIGEAIAVAFAVAGAAVAINHPGERDGALRVARRIRELTGRADAALVLRADVSREAEVQAMFASAVRRWGSIDIVVINAGIQRGAALHAMTLADWQRVIDVNLTGAFLCAREAVREFRRRGRPVPGARAVGTIIATSSVHEHIPWAGEANYAASKGGLRLMMQSLAQEVAADGIRVVSLAPGAIATAINRRQWRDRRRRERLLSLIPWGRVGEVDDVARAAVWLAGDGADYITGTTLVIDGGMSLYPAFRGNG